MYIYGSSEPSERYLREVKYFHTANNPKRSKGTKAVGRLKYVQNASASATLEVLRDWIFIAKELTSMAAASGKELSQPPTRKQVRARIDDADESFRACWQTLTSLKKAGGLDGLALLDFQPLLASALFKLDDAYRRLVHHRGLLIQKKASYSAARFRQRMRTLAQDVEALCTAMRVGRNLGDAFAWTFYQYDQPSLELHFKNPANPHTPPGTGGRGELEFIKQARPPGLLMLYHGITNFLRIGDVSFFDPGTGRISAIGELKSMLGGPGKLMVKMHTISTSREKIPFVAPNRSAKKTVLDHNL